MELLFYTEVDKLFALKRSTVNIFSLFKLAQIHKIFFVIFDRMLNNSTIRNQIIEIWIFIGNYNLIMEIMSHTLCQIENFWWRIIYSSIQCRDVECWVQFANEHVTHVNVIFIEISYLMSGKHKYDFILCNNGFI